MGRPLVAARRRSSRGLSVMEAICAIAILVVIATAATLGGRSQLRHIGARFDELAALTQASSRIEALDAWDHPLVDGDTEFQVDARALPKAHGRQVIQVLEQPGLFKVTVCVRYGADLQRSVELTTYMAREVGP